MKSEINHDTLGFKHRQFAKILKYIGFYTSQNGIKHDQNIKLSANEWMSNKYQQITIMDKHVENHWLLTLNLYFANHRPFSGPYGNASASAGRVPPRGLPAHLYLSQKCRLPNVARVRRVKKNTCKLWQRWKTLWNP